MTTGMGLALAGLTAGSASAATKPKPASVPGVTATTITIGATVPLTGIASPGYNEVGIAADAVFQWVNSHGGVNGRKIVDDLVDDCYATAGFGCTGNPNETADTDSLIAKPVFATVGSLGTPTQAPMRSVLSKAGVPQLFVNSGSIDWNCGVKYAKNTTPYSQYEGCGGKVYPDTFGFQQSYPAESMILAQYMKANYKGEKVCFLGQDDDFGHDGEVGLSYEGITPVVTDYYSVPALVIDGAASIKPYIESFQSHSCTVVYLDTIPGATAAALGNAEGLGYSPKFVISSVGSDPQTIEGLMGGADNETGAISFAELPTNTDTNPWNAWMHKVLEADPQPKYWGTVTNSTVLNGNEAYGIGWGVAFVEALKAAGKTFTRASFVKTLLSTSFQTPALTLLKFSTANHEGLEGGYVSEIKNTTESEPAPGTDGNKAVYVTLGTKGAKITKSTKLSTSVPGWLN
jgi:ABC-type branched-subunit amino acid transport system substrate-binding protein